MAISVPELTTIPGIQWSMAEQSGTETTRTTILRGQSNFGALFNAEILDSLRNSRIGEYGWYAGHNIKYGNSTRFDEISITCVELIVDYNKNGYWSRFEASARTESRPLEEKSTKLATNDETYKVWWNHRAVAKVDDNVTLSEANITTLKSKSSLADGTGVTNVYWKKTNQGLPDGKVEEVLLSARFPGVQSYGVPFEQVKQIVFARDYDVVTDIISAVGKLKAPVGSDGIYYDSNRKDDSKWLVTSASFRKRLGWYEAELTYAYAKGGWLDKGKVAPATGVYPVFGD